MDDRDVPQERDLRYWEDQHAEARDGCTRPSSVYRKTR